MSYVRQRCRIYLEDRGVLRLEKEGGQCLCKRMSSWKYLVNSASFHDMTSSWWELFNIEVDEWYKILYTNEFTVWQALVESLLTSEAQKEMINKMKMKSWRDRLSLVKVFTYPNGNMRVRCSVSQLRIR